MVKISLNTPGGGGGGHFLIRGYWGCAAGWGRIFTTGLTIKYHGVAFSIELEELGGTFSEFWVKTVLHIYS